MTAVGPSYPHIQWLLGVLSPGVKRPQHEAHHSPPSSAEVNDGGNIPRLLHAPSRRDACLIRYSDNFNLLHFFYLSPQFVLKHPQSVFVESMKSQVGYLVHAVENINITFS
jgi:hypothetical protein